MKVIIKHKGGENIKKQTITYNYLIPLLLITLTILFCAGTVSANEIYVNTTGNDTTGNGTAENPYLTLQQGITNVDPNGTIRIANGQYSGENNTNLTINKNMTIIGENQDKTIINGTNTNWIFQIQRDITVTIENLTLSNGYKLISRYYTEADGGAILNLGNLTVTNCTFTNNYVHSPDNYVSSGGAICNSNDGSDSVTCTVTGCNFTNNSADVDGAISNSNSGAGSVTCTVTGCNFTNNTAKEGGAITNYCYVGQDLNSGTGTVTCTVTGCNFTNNTANYGGAIENLCIAYSDSGLVTCNVRECNFNGNNIYNRRYVDGGSGSVMFTANFNRFLNNSQTTVIINQDNPASFVDVENNWWGTNNPDFDSLIRGMNTPTYWLFMTINSTPSTINNTQNSLITASFNNHSSDGTSSSPLDPTNGHIPDGIPVTFSLAGNILGSLAEPLTVLTSNGTASILFTANKIGVQQVNATTANQNVSAYLTINPTSFVDITKEFRDLPWGSVITTAYYNEKIYAIVKVHNLGPDSTESINVQDLLNGLTWTGNYYVLRTVGSYPSNNINSWEPNDTKYPFNGTDWNVGSLSTMIGSERWLAIEVTVNRTGTVSNYAETINQSSYPYQGYANYTAYLTTTNTPTSITANDVSGNKGDTVTLKAVLTDYLGNPLAGKTVKFWIDNIEIGQNTTDNTGTALFNYIINQTPGNHTLTATFNETNYQESNATGSLYVPTANLYLEITSDKNNPPISETFTLTYKLGNYGPDTANNVTVIIPVPEGFHILQIYGDGNWTINTNGTITWTFNNVTVGDPYLHLYGYASGDEDIFFTGSIFSDTYNANSIGVNSLNLQILPEETSEVNAATTTDNKTVGMQNTGMPLAGIVLAILMVFGGLINTRKKQ